MNTEAPKQISRKELGKLRRIHLTIQHSTVTACGHKFVQTKQPNNNCPDCWSAFFRLVQNVEDLHGILAKQGTKGLTTKFGRRFVKQFGKYLQMELPTMKGTDGISEEA